jgi:chromosome segregation ATPase
MRSAREFAKSLRGWDILAPDTYCTRSTMEISYVEQLVQEALNEGYSKGYAEVANCHTRICQLENAITTSQAELQQKILHTQTLEKKLTSTSSQIASLNSQISTLTLERNNAVTTANNLKIQHQAAIKNEQQQLAATKSSLEGKINNLSAQLTAEQTKFSSAIEDIKNQHLTDITSSHQELAMTTTAIKNLNITMAREKTSFTKKIDLLETTLSDSDEYARTEIEHLNLKKEKLNLNVKKAKLEIAEAKHETEIIKSRLKLAEIQIEELKYGLQKSEHTVRALQATVRDSNKYSDKLILEIEELKSTLTKLQNENKAQSQDMTHALPKNVASSNIPSGHSSTATSSNFFSVLNQPSAIDSYRAQRKYSNVTTPSKGYR